MLRRACPLFASALLACSASGSNDQTHGPVFDLDGSAAVDATVPVDGAAVGDASDAGDASVTPAQDGALADVGAEAAPIDSGADVGPVDAGSDTAPCTGVTAVFGGSATSLFGASAVGRAALVAQSPALTGAVASVPAVAAFGAGFQALSRDNANGLRSASLAPPTWSAIGALPGAPTTLDAPALAVVGATLHGVYLDTKNLFEHVTWGGSSWSPSADPVGHLGDGGAQAFGPGRASAVGLATELVIAYVGNSSHLYAQSWTSAGGWTDGVQVGTASVPSNVAPSLVALSGGAHDLLVVYEDAADTKIYSFARDAVSRAWNVGPTVVDATAFTHEAPSLVAVPGGGAVVGWRGTDGLGYVSAYDPLASAGASPAWSAPKALVAGANPAIAVAPSFARGNCGDDAVAAYVSGGGAFVTRLAGGAWSAPVAVSGVSGAAVVAIATDP